MEISTADMRRLHLQIYVALLAVLALFALLVGATFWHLEGGAPHVRRLAALTAFAEASIPPPEAEAERLERWASAITRGFEIDLTIYDRDERALVTIGPRLPPPAREGGSRFLTRAGHDHGQFVLALADGRSIVVRDGRPRAGLHFAGALLLLALATGIAAHPLSRRLTRRLESLRSHVEQFGEGRFALRVPIEGHDEIAQLARAFNGTADRIERLVADKTRLLAATSHELRTPLARVRTTLELLRDGPRPELLTQAERDLQELDQLIGELLVASRLDAPEQSLEREPVDLLALAAEEAARLAGVQVGSAAPSPNGPASGAREASAARTVSGDPRLLRRLIRNLLENALRHGEPPVEVAVGPAPHAGFVRLRVSDRGPGIPEASRARIFEPFYRPPRQASARAGVGLGLALVRQISERHGGRIDCEARPGGGTDFVLDLPRADA